MNKAPAAYALCTPAKLAVGTTTPSLCRRTDAADIWHFFHRYFRKAVLVAEIASPDDEIEFEVISHGVM